MIVTPSTPVKTASYLEPAAPRRRLGRAVTSLGTRRALRAAPAPSTTIGSVVVAGHADDRCEHRSGWLRCVRGPHLDSPQAHVLVAGAPDPHHVPVPVRTPVGAPGRTAASAPAASLPAAVCCA